MLLIKNKTPFQAGLSLITDQTGTDKACVMVKGTFKLNSKAEPKKKQLPLFRANQYYGEPGKSSIKYPADFILGKINTDIGLIGAAHSPKPVTELPVLLQAGELRKIITVFGDRHWEKNSIMPGFSKSMPIPFQTMPLSYERAFGGKDNTHQDKKKHEKYENNPVGTGFRLNKEAVKDHKLPNLENSKDLISAWRDKPQVAGLGFIETFWGKSSEYAGTYDDEWKEKQFPLLPKDFDLRYFNTASPGLVADGFFKGGESVQIVNLSQKGDLKFNLPEIKLNCMLRLRQENIFQNPDIYTVLFEPDKERFYIVWGTSFAIGKQPSLARYVNIEIEENNKQV